MAIPITDEMISLGKAEDVAPILRACLLRFNDLGREMAEALEAVSADDDDYNEALAWLSDGIDTQGNGFQAR